MTDKQVDALRLADYLDLPHVGQHKSAAELRRLHAENEALRHNNMVLMDALWKACGDNAEAVMGTIESVGGLK